MTRAIVPALVLALAVLAACGDDDGADSRSPSPSASTTPAATPTATPSPTPFPATPVVTPIADDSLRIVFFRPYGDRSQYSGRLWISGIDGSGAQPVTPGGVDATFAGMSGGDTFYWAELVSEEEAVLWQQTFSTGGREELLRFGKRFSAYTEVSPDGAHIAYIDFDSVYLLDLATGEKSLLLQGNGVACGAPASVAPGAGAPAPPCFTYRNPRWSPDGEMIVVWKVFYEGGVAVIVYPDNPAEIEVGDGEFSSAHIAEWSPDSRALCVLGQYAAPSAVYIARSPDWAVATYLQGMVAPTPGPGFGLSAGTASGCTWPSSDRLIVSIANSENGYPATIGALDPDDGTFTEFEFASDDEGYSRELIGAPGQRLAITQAFLAGGVQFKEPGKLHQVDVNTGAIAPILQPGDWAVAVVYVGG